jgi:hypothetical protein
MGLNIGTPAAEACRGLRGSKEFALVLAELRRMWSDRLIAAASSPVEQRIEATAYARALLDLWVGYEAATSGKNPRAVATVVEGHGDLFAEHVSPHEGRAHEGRAGVIEETAPVHATQLPAESRHGKGHHAEPLDEPPPTPKATTKFSTTTDKKG